jgi:hypothetical protein
MNEPAPGTREPVTSPWPDAALPEAGTVSACAFEVSVTPAPFGCDFAWGANGAGGNRASYLDFITTWVGYEREGGLGGQCDGCGLVRELQNTNAMAVYYAYFIGFQTNEAGLGDCNTDFDGNNLCTGGAQWIGDNWSRIVDMYGNYARMTHEAAPNQPTAWLLEGDYIQYTDDSQSSPLSFQAIGDLTTEIVSAIKANQPAALVAVNHSSWVRNPTLGEYFEALPLELVDFVWTTGMGDVNGGYLNDGDSSNRMDGTYEYLHELTGKGVFVDTSFGASQQDDSWSNAGADNLNARIGWGVIAANVTEPPNDYSARIDAVRGQLDDVCD